MAKSSDLAKDDLYKLRHSAAHVMAQAVLEIHPQAKIAIGPPIENGFYYDFDLGKGEDGKPRSFTPEDLTAIEKRMRQVIGGRHPFQYRQVSAYDARQLFSDQPYKLELLEGVAQGGIDEYGNEELDYSDADEVVVAGCLFAPKPSIESDEGHNPRQAAVLYCPAGTTVTPTMFLGWS